MPLVEIPLQLAGSPTSSERQYVRGLLDLVDIRYEASAPAVVVILEECVQDDGQTQTYTERWKTTSTNTNAYYLPVKGTTLQDGSAGASEAHIPLRSQHGWRVRVTGGASTGLVRVFVGLDQ